MMVDHFGRLGKNAGQFYRLHNLNIDSRGNLYTTEVNAGQRFQKFNPSRRVGCEEGWASRWTLHCRLGGDPTGDDPRRIDIGGPDTLTLDVAQTRQARRPVPPRL